jgi:hypothetical protein
MATITLTLADKIAINQLRRSHHADGVRAVLDKQLAEHRRLYEVAPASEDLRVELDLIKTSLYLLFTEAI